MGVSFTIARDVFISYVSSDAEAAKAACEAIERAGLMAWIAPRDVSPGITYADSILKGLHECPVFVLIYSARTGESAHVEREVERAVSMKKRIVPCRVENVRPSGTMEYFLSTPHWFDAFPRSEKKFDELARVVHGLVQGGEAPLQARARFSAPSQSPRIPAPTTTRAMWAWAGAILVAGALGVGIWTQVRGTKPSMAGLDGPPSALPVPAGVQDVTAIVRLSAEKRASIEEEFDEPPLGVYAQSSADGKKPEKGIVIRPAGKFFDDYFHPEVCMYDAPSADAIVGPPHVWMDFPSIEFFVTNNSSKTVSIERVELDVRSSTPDLSPLVLEVDDPTRLLGIRFFNDGWTGALSGTLTYQLAMKQKVGPTLTRLSAEKTRGVTFTTFDDADRLPECEVDLSEDCRAYGVNVEQIRAYQAEESRVSELFDEEGAEDDAALTQELEKLEALRTAIQKPDEGIVAFGDLKLEYADSTGSKRTQRVHFHLTIPIVPPDGLGAAAPETGSSDAMLETSGDNYQVSVPVSQFFKAGDAARFSVRLGAKRSSIHDFTPTLVCTDGSRIVCQPVRLHMLVTRSHAIGLRQTVEAEQARDEVRQRGS